MFELRRSVLTFAVCLLSGIAGALLVNRAFPAPANVDAPTSRVVDNPRIETERVRTVVRSADTSEFERRLELLERRNVIAESTDADSSQIEAPEAFELERVRSELAFAAEVIDDEWAETAQTDFENDLMLLSGTFAASDIECRTTLCRAELTWETFSQAQQETPGLLHFNYRHNCIRRVMGAPPQEEKGTYSAALYFDCTNIRTDG